MRKFKTLLLLTTLFSLLILAQDGGIHSPTSSANAAGYSCHPGKSNPLDCNCSSVDPGIWWSSPREWYLLLVSMSNVVAIVAKLIHPFFAFCICYCRRMFPIYRVHGRRRCQIVHFGYFHPVPHPAQKPNGRRPYMIYFTSLAYTDHSPVGQYACYLPFPLSMASKLRDRLQSGPRFRVGLPGFM